MTDTYGMPLVAPLQRRRVVIYTIRREGNNAWLVNDKGRRVSPRGPFHIVLTKSLRQATHLTDTNQYPMYRGGSLQFSNGATIPLTDLPRFITELHAS